MIQKAKKKKRDRFSSKFGVIAAAAGSAVGLGNIWRFPYVAGENGGGAFLLIYLIFIFAIGLPAMLSELLLGRKAQRNTFGTFRKLAPATAWPLVGLMGVVCAFLILAFYSTISGWTLEYLYQAVIGGFAHGETKAMFAAFQKATFRPLMWQMIFMALTGSIIYAGVKNGIEKYAKILMPLLFVLILAMCIRSLSLPGASAGLIFLFQPDFSKITVQVILEALGQAAFSLSVGMGTLITYGSYIKKTNNLGSTATQVTITDTLIAILSGIMIFPAVFALGFQPDSGAGLVFEVLPKLFLQMPGGYIFAIIFFFLLAVAALTSTISILEVVTAYFSEELKLSRKKATVLGAVSISFLGIFATLSFSDLANFNIFGFTIFGLMEYISANILLPLGALLIVIFTGWIIKKQSVKEELSNDNTLEVRYFNIFYFIIKWLAPVAIATVFINGLA